MNQKVFYKYQLEIIDKQILQLPKCCTISALKEQNGVLTMWCLVDNDNKEKENIVIKIFGTGQSFEYNEKFCFIETVFMDNGLV